MDRTDAARRLAPVVSEVAARFMLDAATYVRGGELGYEGVDFYVAGRAGVLGDVDADVVSAAFVYFEPANVRAAWERARAVAAPADSAREFAQCAARWADEHLSEQEGLDRFAELLGLVVAHASPAAAPLFAGWRRLPEPQGTRALVLHRLNALRELRGALHAGAVLAEGVAPLEALSHRSPYMVGMFGWAEPAAADQIDVAAWERAEAATDRAFSRSLDRLDDAQVEALVGLAESLTL